MCTVVFIPGDDGYYFASLRDENPLRQKALLPMNYEDDNIKYLAPLDPAGNGTWIGMNECGHVIILLNGAFLNHIKQPVYARSRGAIVKELLSGEMPVIAWSLMELNSVEPFTLIVWADEKLFQLVWDGQNKHRFLLSASIPHIFSSATLYEDICKAQRKLLFESWINSRPAVTASSLLDFFKTASSDTENGFIINRSGKLKTLSYSFIEIKKEHAGVFHYYDNLQDITKVTTIKLLMKEGAYSFTINN